MSSSSEIIELDREPGQVALEEAFRKFNEAGERLEARYLALREETEDLRAQLRAKDLEVKRAEKLALLGETAAAIAHEVRNPLGAIKLFLSALEDEVKNAPEAMRLLGHIHCSIGTLDHTVSNILQFSKSQNLKSAPLNLNALIHEQALLFKPYENKGLKLVLALKAAPFIAGNEHGLRQVIYNLILNAAQATRYQGEIEIETRDCDQHLELYIRDNGSGIPEDILSKVFEPFVTSKSEGTGLGLAVVQQVMLQHSGSIKASNRVGTKGAEFKIQLPRTKRSE